MKGVKGEINMDNTIIRLNKLMEKIFPLQWKDKKNECVWLHSIIKRQKTKR